MQDSLQQSLKHLHNVLDKIERIKEEESKMTEVEAKFGCRVKIIND